MVAAQHVESQVALYLFVMLPLPKDELLSSFFVFFPPAFTFISPPLLNCFKLQIEHISLVHICILISLVVLTLHTSASILLLICCTCAKTHKKITLITNVFSVITSQFYFTTDMYTVFLFFDHLFCCVMPKNCTLLGKFSLVIELF